MAEPVTPQASDTFRPCRGCRLCRAGVHATGCGRGTDSAGPADANDEPVTPQASDTFRPCRGCRLCRAGVHATGCGRGTDSAGPADATHGADAPDPTDQADEAHKAFPSAQPPLMPDWGTGTSPRYLSEMPLTEGKFRPASGHLAACGHCIERLASMLSGPFDHGYTAFEAFMR
jgi:hypothetical protein